MNEIKLLVLSHPDQLKLHTKLDWAQKYSLWTFADECFLTEVQEIKTLWVVKFVPHLLSDDYFLTMNLGRNHE